MGTPATGRRRPRRCVLRAALVALLLLVTLFAPAAGVAVAVTSGGGTSGCTAPEAHEELRPGRPDRERPRPALPRAARPAIELAAPGGGLGVARPAADLAQTQVDALPHPLDRIPIKRN
jgi:hypothetical protein